MSNIDTTVSAIKEIAMWHEHQADNSMPSFATTKMHRQYAANLFALAAEKEEIEGIQSEFAPEKFGGIADSLYAMSAEMRGLRTLLVKKEMEPVYKAFSAPQPAAPSDAGAVPEGWVPLTITFEEGYPEEVAYGPKRMMDRLKKWLDKFYELRLAAAPEAPQPKPRRKKDAADDIICPTCNLPCHPNIPCSEALAWSAPEAPQPGLPQGYISSAVSGTLGSGEACLTMHFSSAEAADAFQAKIAGEAPQPDPVGLKPFRSFDFIKSQPDLDEYVKARIDEHQPSVRVPLSDEQVWDGYCKTDPVHPVLALEMFVNGVRFAEEHYGITSTQGGGND